jgi:hypothetical protein
MEEMELSHLPNVFFCCFVANHMLPSCRNEVDAVVATEFISETLVCSGNADGVHLGRILSVRRRECF